MQKAVKVQGCFMQQNYSLFNKGLFESASVLGVNTLLSGFGGDEAVSASHSTAWNEILTEGRPDIFASELFYQGISPRTTAKGIKLIIKFLLKKLSLTNPQKEAMNRKILEKRFSSLALQHGYALKHALKEEYFSFYGRTLPAGYAARQWANVMHNHLPQRMEYCDTAAGQYGIVYRYPLLDLELIENMLAFPAWTKVHHGKPRFLIREAIRGMVPEEIRQRNDKSGVPIPHTHLSLLKERDEILGFVSNCSGNDFLKTIFNFEIFPSWYERLIKRDAHELNYLMPGAFYKYLMIMMYISHYE
jgi:asparagine synthase (glutamine-hydrolysing)